MFSKFKPTPEAEPTAMRNRTATGSSASGSTFSVIAADVTISGDITAEVDLHIDGTVIGDVRCANLVQGAGSTITGGVMVQSARLGGKVDGSIEAVDLVIEASAQVTGDVAYNNLTVEAGGRVEGALHRLNANGEPSSESDGDASAKVESIQKARDIGALRA